MAVKPGAGRAIFQEVATAEKPAATPGGIDGGRRDARGAIRLWLMVLFALVAAMIVVGGLTRLTDSGLSIPDWRPFSGAIPPLTEADWQAQFDLYKTSPQYEAINRGMDLAEFKSIFWWEWGHRQWGRVIGLIWAAGFLFFWATKRVPPGWTRRLLWIGFLGGLQGALGAWMVQSGQQAGMISVASYRLALHLGLGFIIFGFITWYALLLSRREIDLMQARRTGERRLFGGATGLMHLAFVQILLGALVAGIDAGRAFPTWPDMGGAFLPPEMWELTPWWRNFFENAGTVQFVHRMAGYLLFALGIVVWLRARKSPHPATRFAFGAVMAMLLLQIVLGIVTALYSAPLHAAITHQVGAIVLWVLVLRGRLLARYPVAQSLRG